MTTSEKVAYLKGLAEGMGVDQNGKEGKILSTILDVLEDLALEVEDLGADVAELGESLDAVSDDLEDVERLLCDDEDDEDGPDGPWNDGEPWDGETVFYECRCPSCGETVTFEQSVLDNGSIRCPNCGEELEFIGEEDGEQSPAPDKE